AGFEAMAQQLPPGVPPPAAGSGTGRTGLTWTTPKGWVSEPVTSSMRRAQYKIPGPGGAGECVVFYFGPGQGGDAETTAGGGPARSEHPDASPRRRALNTRRVDSTGTRVMLPETPGPYRGGMPGGPAAPTRPDYMLLGAIARGPDANWFFK